MVNLVESGEGCHFARNMKAYQDGPETFLAVVLVGFEPQIHKSGQHDPANTQKPKHGISWLSTP